MAEVIFRLPGKEPFSYVEVSTNDVEANEPDFEERVLQAAISSLNSLYAGAGTASGGQQPTQSNSRPSGVPDYARCTHGDMTLRKGQSGKGPWEAYMCSAKNRDEQCKPVWMDLKTGRPQSGR